MTPQQTLLIQLRDAAKAGKHTWPEYAACEGAYDSNFDEDGLIAAAKNVFEARAIANGGFEQRTIRVMRDRPMPGGTVSYAVDYLRLPSLADAFSARMAKLKQFRSIYYDALNADTAEEFIMQVSARWNEMPTEFPPSQLASSLYYSSFMGKWYRFNGGRWSVDPQRAANVLALYEANKEIF